MLLVSTDTTALASPAKLPTTGMMLRWCLLLLPLIRLPLSSPMELTILVMLLAELMLLTLLKVPIALNSQWHLMVKVPKLRPVKESASLWPLPLARSHPPLPSTVFSIMKIIRWPTPTVLHTPWTNGANLMLYLSPGPTSIWTWIGKMRLSRVFLIKNLSPMINLLPTPGLRLSLISRLLLSLISPMLLPSSCLNSLANSPGWLMIHSHGRRLAVLSLLMILLSMVLILQLMEL